MGRSPSKEIRARSPEKQIIPMGLSPAKSEQQIASSIEKKRESRRMEHLNTAVENRAKEEERKREEERRHNEENERRRKEDDRRRKEEERRKIEERRQKEERRKSGVRDSREKSPPKPVKNPDNKEERRRDSRDSKSGGRRNIPRASPCIPLCISNALPSASP